MKNQKMLVLILGLLIIVGIIIVALKGFNVDFMLKQHQSIEYKISENFEIADVENIAKEVFGKKQFKVRIIELFNDSVSINAESISDEEAKALIEKLDEKYNKKEEKTENSTKETTENNKQNAENTEIEETTIEESEDNLEENKEDLGYTIIRNPKIKLTSLFKPYIIAIVYSSIAIILYVLIRFKKLNSIKVLINLIEIVLLTVLSILSILAIVRFPINTFVIPVIMIIVLFELAIYFAKKENELEK